MSSTGRVTTVDPNQSSAAYNPETDELIQTGDEAPTAFRRKVIRTVRKPFTIEEKVPVTTRRVVETQVETKIMSTKLVEVPDFEEVQEPYTEYVEEKVQVPVKKWVEETIMEEYVEKVPVQKTRVVRRPVTKIEEVDDYQLVRVPGTKVIEVDGWRVDEIEDRKVIEVEEYEVYEFLPQSTGKVVRGDVRDVETVATAVVRKTGALVYSQDDVAASGIDFDAIEEDDSIKEPIEAVQPVWGPEMFTEEISQEEYERLVGNQGQAAAPQGDRKSRRRRKGGNNQGDSAMV